VNLKGKISEQGKEILLRKLKANKINPDTNNLHKLAHYYKQQTVLDLYYKIGKGQIDLKSLKRFKVDNGNIKTSTTQGKKKIEEIVSQVRGKTDSLVIGDNVKDLKYRLAKCCNPIAGDDIFGFISSDGEITIHRVNCPNAINMMSKYAYRVVKAKWRTHDNISFLAGIKITGIDELGLVNRITKIISEQMNVNMRSINFETDDGIFEGKIILYVYDTEHLHQLIEKLKKVKGVLQVERMDNQ
jgi:GTP pyrophosphokinase